MRPEDKERIVSEVMGRVLDREMTLALKNPAHLEDVIADTIYHELARLKTEPKTAETARHAGSLQKLRSQMLQASDTERRDILKKMVKHFVSEVVGNFSPRVYDFATRLLPTGLSLLFNALSPKRMLANLPHLPDLKDQIRLRGELAQLQALSELGTILLVPTHSSNLDSIIIGYAIYNLGLPPFVYGAGLNLFSNPLTSFFMNNLGAYKVDRKKQAPLYKEVLKEYCATSIEMGYHNIFFPGGTRSRSGMVEQHLKLGLLGCGLQAFIRNLQLKRDKPNVFVVPCTLSYELVLEAESLIEDYLKETGKSRYVMLTRDESWQPVRILNFISSVLALDTHINVTFSQALDPFGNLVDLNGVSRDPRGREIDIRRYVHVEGSPAPLLQRDEQFTRELGVSVARAYLRDNVLMSTNLAAYAMFSLLQEINRGTSLYRLLRTGGAYDSVGATEVTARLRDVIAALQPLAAHGRVRIDEDLEGLPAEDVLAQALRHFGTYHSKPAIRRRGNRLYAENMNLLFFYSNRLAGYDLETTLGRRKAEEAA
jgi:glycerol-3-phosphate O-acyltransferase